MTSPGTLWLVPNTLDLGSGDAPAIEQVLPLSVLHTSAKLSFWVAENAKTTRAFLKRVHAVAPLGQALQELSIVELPRAAKGGNAAPSQASFDALLAPARAGHDIGLISEAGLPALADPGAGLVAAAHRAGLRVVPLPGPSSIALALAASGLHGQSFAFHGYLPVDAAARAARIRALEAQSLRDGQTQLAIETPYRNAALAHALIETLGPETRLAIACGLTLPGGWCRMARVREWRHAPPDFGAAAKPAVFAWLAGAAA